MMNEVTMNNITNDIATRLLAQENLLIHRAPVRTASFDVKNRILTLPQWKNMTTEIEEMLKAHEVGHALYTNEDALESIKDSGVPFGYVNILEDARIEKLMKRKYPGLRRIFNIGYRELNELDFFDMKRNANRKLLLIDRINLYFKVGYTAGIKFSVAEKYLVDQVERLESMDEVITLAKRIHAFTKQELEEEKRKRQNSQEYKKIQEEIEQEEQQYLDDMEELDDHYEDESMSGDDDWTSSSDDSDDDDDFEEKHEPNKGYGREDEEEQFGVTPDQQMSEDVPMTDRALDEKLRDLADVNTRYTYLTLPDTSKLEKTIIPYKKVLADAKLGVEAALQKATELSQNYNDPEILTQYHNRYAEHLANYEKFKSETTRVVNYLIKEFEMKKAATNYKRTQIAKTGVLDVRKLAFYKTREDLFKQVRIEKDGQRHGMIFLLDWSGSMCDVINETAKQLISLVFFCYRAKIPFQVFAFTDRRFIDDENYEEYKKYHASLAQPNTVQLDAGFHLIEFFSNKMTQSELQTMARTFYMMTVTSEYTSSKYHLYGTPLNESLVYMYNYAEKFIRDNNVEKFSLIKLTDGEGGRMCNYYNKSLERNYMQERYWENDQKIINKYFLRDPVSKKEFQYDMNNTTPILCEMIKAKYNCSVIGYHVTGRSLGQIMNSLTVYGIYHIDAREMVGDVRRAMNNELFYSLKVPGHDDLFLMPNTIKVEEKQLDEPMGEMTANQIARKFGKYLGAKRTSRVLLNRFVQLVA
jgi:hypothetical protein